MSLIVAVDMVFGDIGLYRQNDAIIRYDPSTMALNIGPTTAAPSGSIVKITGNFETEQVSQLTKEVSQLRQKVDGLTKQVDDLLAKMEKVYYAPNMPGFFEGQVDFQEQVMKSVL